MDALDRKLIEYTQAGLPLTSRPFQTLGKQINLSETETLQRITALQQCGIIRRIGVVPNHYALGYRFNAMTVWDIEDNAIQICGEKLGKLGFVSHCYQRPRHPPEWPYNLFAMVHGKTEAEMRQKISLLYRLIKDHCRQYDALISKRILKKTGFRFTKVDHPPQSGT